MSNSQFWVNKHLLTFNHTFNDKHRVNLLVGFEAQAGKYEYLFASRDNLPNNALKEINLGDVGQQQTGGGAGHWALMSGFTRLNYTFDDRYLFTATFRADGSSRFGPNNRFGYFPSGAFAWRISEEGFAEQFENLSNLKVRAGVGVVGNQEIGLYSYSSNLRAVSVAMGNQLFTGFAPDNIANPDVKWESSLQYNVGLDLGLFNDRIQVIADYYVRKATDMLLPALIPLTAGNLNPPFVNIGAIENRGIELGLNTVNLTGPVEWRTNLNYTRNINEVVNLGSTGNLVGVIQRIPVSRTVEGLPIAQFYGYVMDGIFQSFDEVAESPFQQTGTKAGDIKFKDLNKDGIINEDDQTFIGSPHPDFSINFSNTISYKGFDLNVFFQGVFGNEILNLLRRDTEGMSGRANHLRRVLDRWTVDNPSNTMPRAEASDPNNNRRISTRYIEDGSFIRLKNITIGYTLPRSVLGRFRLNTLRIYASSQNVFTWTNYSGYDPEIGSFNQNPLISGVDNGRYPISRSFTFGLNMNF